MVRALLVLLLVALLPATASTQAVRDHEGEGGLRSFHGPGSGGRIKRSFQPDAEARAEFDRILAAIGLSPMADRITCTQARRPMARWPTSARATSA